MCKLCDIFDSRNAAISNAFLMGTKSIKAYYRSNPSPQQKTTFSACFANFGASLFDIAKTLSKLTSELCCVQYKRGASALLQQRLERTQESAELK